MREPSAFVRDPACSVPAPKPKPSIEPFGPLLERQRDVFDQRFGPFVAASLDGIPSALAEDRVSSYVSRAPGELGYALVVPSPGPETDVLTTLWVENGEAPVVRSLVGAAVAESYRKRRRLEAQDLGFGESDVSAELRELALRSWDRLYLCAELVDQSRADEKRAETTLRSFAHGDLIPAASISTHAFASTSDPEFSVSHRSASGALKRLGLAVSGSAWGPFESGCSPVAIGPSGQVKGFAVVTRFGPETAHLGEIAVSPDAANQGIGSVLLDWSLAQVRKAGMKKMTLCVSADNERALALYRSRGFRTANRFRAHVLSPGKNVDLPGQKLPPSRRSSAPEPPLDEEN